MIIAVDGPAASGKGTIARALAAHYGLPHMDTGLLYRAVALNLLRWGGDPADEREALGACDFSQIDFADPELKSEAAGGIASRISAFPLVRAALIKRQRDFAEQAGGAVLDGRDIGTVIGPDADAKLFVTASPEVRAGRRHLELQGRGEATTSRRCSPTSAAATSAMPAATRVADAAGRRRLLAGHQRFGYRSRIRYRRRRDPEEGSASAGVLEGSAPIQLAQGISGGRISTSWARGWAAGRARQRGRRHPAGGCCPETQPTGAGMSTAVSESKD